MICDFFYVKAKCVFPENFHTPGGFQKPNFVKESMALKWNFQRGWEGGGRGFKPKQPSMGGVWIFSGTTQYGLQTRSSQLKDKSFWCLVPLFIITKSQSVTAGNVTKLVEQCPMTVISST